jgi:hypothetical protein
MDKNVNRFSLCFLSHFSVLLKFSVRIFKVKESHLKTLKEIKRKTWMGSSVLPGKFLESKDCFAIIEFYIIVTLI